MTTRNGKIARYSAIGGIGALLGATWPQIQQLICMLFCH